MVKKPYCGCCGANLPICVGFTLIELLVVMAVVATLLALVAPRYFVAVDRGKEAALKADLRGMRDALGKFHYDRGTYPTSLEELVSARYLYAIPPDPMTERGDTWVAVPLPDHYPTVIWDVRSGAAGQGLDGTEYAHW